MRRVYAALLLAFCLAGLVVWGNRTMDTVLTQTEELLLDVQEASAAGAYKKADGIYHRLLENFHQKEKLLSLLLKHDLLTELSCALHGIGEYNDLDHQAELASETRRAIDRLHWAANLYFTAY